MADADRLKTGWMVINQTQAFGYCLPESHLLHALQNADSLLVQRISTHAVSPGQFLANVMFFNPLFAFLALMPVTAVGLRFVPGADYWTSAQWLLTALGITYALALISTCRWRLFKAFRERHQHVGEKRITLDFKRGKLQVEERLDAMPHRNSCIVLALDRLQPIIKTHLHDPDSDVDLCDEMQLHLGVPRALHLPDWARWKLDQPVYVCTFDNGNAQDKTNTEIEIHKVLELLKQRLHGNAARNSTQVLSDDCTPQ